MTKPSAQPAPTDPPAFVLLNEIGIIEQLARTRFEALQPDGLLLPHFTLLNHLVRVGDGRSPVAIARALQLAKGAITNTLQRLEARGLVRVEPDPEDGRGKRVFLTAAGRRRRDAAVTAVAGPGRGDRGARRHGGGRDHRPAAPRAGAARPGPRMTLGRGGRGWQAGPDSQERAAMPELSPRDVLGWRRLFGVMAPSTNTVVQPDFDDMRPAGVTNHMSRIFTPDADAVSNESFRAGIAVISGNMLDAVRSVMTCHPDHLVMGMSAITFFGGRAGADGFVRQVREESGLDVTVGSHACDAALRAYGGVKRIAVLSPYWPVMNEAVRGYFEDMGYTVVRDLALQSPSWTGIARITPARVPSGDPGAGRRRRGRDRAGRARTCRWCASPRRRRLLLGKPVIAINAATYWHALRTVGIADRKPGLRAASRGILERGRRRWNHRRRESRDKTTGWSMIRGGGSTGVVNRPRSPASRLSFPGTTRTLRGAAAQMQAAETTQQAMAMIQAAR